MLTRLRTKVRKAPEAGLCDRMTSVKKKRRRAVVEQAACVACGCCVKVCPLRAIEIVRGVMAQADGEKCVGCGKCARECPASVIEIREVET